MNTVYINITGEQGSGKSQVKALIKTFLESKGFKVKDDVGHTLYVEIDPTKKPRK